MATGAQIDLIQAQNNAAYDRLDPKAKKNYIDPEAAAGAAATGAYLTGAGAGAGAGAGIGAAIGGTATVGTLTIPAAGVGAIIGGVVGTIGVAVSGAADAAAEAAAEAAEASNDKTSRVVEGIAQALASGKLIDTGSGYELAKGISESELFSEFRIEVEELDQFYSSLSDATDELREFGSALNTNKAQEDAYYDSMAL